MQLPAEFQKGNKSQMPSQMAASANSSNLKKEKVQAVVVERYPGAVVMQPPVFDRTAISGCARESMLIHRRT
jgi:hypothetical protein